MCDVLLFSLVMNYLAFVFHRDYSYVYASTYRIEHAILLRSGCVEWSMMYTCEVDTWHGKFSVRHMTVGCLHDVCRYLGWVARRVHSHV